MTENTPSLINANQDSVPLTLSSKRQHRVRAIFVSDVHLGTKDSKAQLLNEFLKHYRCETLYLVGDILDGWKMRTGIYWISDFNKVIRRLLKMSKRGVKVMYITGNHDEFLRKHANNRFDNIHLINRCEHTSVSGSRFLVLHGDQFESVTHAHRWLHYVGDFGYDFLMWANRLFNRWRARYGYGYWSFAGYLKQHLHTAQKYIDLYEDAVAQGAHKGGYHGVICGHIHQAAHKQLHGVTYMNTGDWVESCTAVVEELDGTMRLVFWLRERQQFAKSAI
jgi:UDP-2,3-diacylglucosamine pyrophosphatase LpxH